MAAHILQVAYYPNLQETRALMLKSAGYEVTSVLGNDQARGLDQALIAAADLIVVGFSAPYSVRTALAAFTLIILALFSGNSLNAFVYFQF